MNETIRLWLHAASVLIAALALVGAASYWGITHVVAQQTNSLENSVLLMQRDISGIQTNIAELQLSIADIRNVLLWLQAQEQARQAAQGLAPSASSEPSSVGP